MAAEELAFPSRDTENDIENAAEDGKPRRPRPSRGMYVLPSLFTAGNMGLGYYAITQSVQGTAADTAYFDHAALAIGLAALCDGLDGLVARATHTTSDFGRELDSLADVITFGVAPSLLAYIWGFRMLPLTVYPAVRENALHAGVFVCFLFLICGACRLARFNISINPQPRNPGKPGHKYFVGMPIPAGAGVIAAVVHFLSGEPLVSWRTSVSWLLMVVVVAYLMVSTWRFYSFKDIDFRSRHPFRLIVIFGILIASIRYFSGPVLFGISVLYMASGILWRLQWIFRRKAPPAPPPSHEASLTS